MKPTGIRKVAILNGDPAGINPIVRGRLGQGDAFERFHSAGVEHRHAWRSCRSYAAEHAV
jgi:hypothetical protein